MILQIVAVYDGATQMFMRPFFVNTKAQATRTFQNEVNRKESDNPLNTNPDDFSLYHLGDFDDADGQFNVHTPEILARAKDMVKE